MVLGREGPYFVKEHSDAKNKYTEEDIIKMLEFLVDNMFVVFAGKVFQQIVGIPMGTNCAPLLADIFLYHASDKIVGILLDRSRSHDSMKITVLGVEIRIGRLIEFEAGDEQSKMADDELVAMDLSWGFSFCTDF